MVSRLGNGSDTATSGHMGMSVSIFSYCGEVTVGLMVDATLVPDPDTIVAQLGRELESLRRIRTGTQGKRTAPRRRGPDAGTPAGKERSNA